MVPCASHFAFGSLRRLALEHVDEEATDDPPLLLRIVDAGERREHLVGGIDVDDPHAEVAGERVHHLRGLVQAQQAVVDEHAGELRRRWPCGSAPRRRRSPRRPTGRGSPRRRRPARGSARWPRRRSPPCSSRSRSRRCRARSARGSRRPASCGSPRDGTERRRSGATRRPSPRSRTRSTSPSSLKPGGSAVTLSPWLIQTSSSPWPCGVAPDPGCPRSSVVVPVRAHLGVAELAHRARLDRAAQLRRHRLHAVADAEHRHAERPDDLRRPRRVAFGHAFRPARQDDAPRRERANRTRRPTS